MVNGRWPLPQKKETGCEFGDRGPLIWETGEDKSALRGFGPSRASGLQPSPLGNVHRRPLHADGRTIVPVPLEGDRCAHVGLFPRGKEQIVEFLIPETLQNQTARLNAGLHATGTLHRRRRRVFFLARSLRLRRSIPKTQQAHKGQTNAENSRTSHGPHESRQAPLRSVAERRDRSASSRSSEPARSLAQAGPALAPIVFWPRRLASAERQPQQSAGLA